MNAKRLLKSIALAVAILMGLCVELIGVAYAGAFIG